MTSLAIAMVVFSVLIRSVPLTPAGYPRLQLSVTVAFTVFTALGLAGIWASYTRGRVLHQGRDRRT